MLKKLKLFAASLLVVSSFGLVTSAFAAEQSPSNHTAHVTNKPHVGKKHVTKKHVTKKHAAKKHVAKKHVVKKHVVKKHLAKKSQHKAAAVKK